MDQPLPSDGWLNLLKHHRQRNGLASGGPEGHGAELMINIAIASMHAIHSLHRHSWLHLFDEWGARGPGAMAPWPPCSAAYEHDNTLHTISITVVMRTYTIKQRHHG